MKAPCLSGELWNIHVAWITDPAKLLQESDIVHNLLFACRFESGEGMTITVVAFLRLDIKFKP